MAGKTALSPASTLDSGLRIRSFQHKQTLRESLPGAPMIKKPRKKRAKKKAGRRGR